jgi:ankyrin repeat protein
MTISHYTPTREQATEWLLRAINQRDERGAKRWLEAGADPNTVAATGGSDHMLAHAIEQGATALMCKILLDHGALITPTDSDRTLLHKAAMRGNAAVCEELVKRGAHVDDGTPEDMTPLMAAAGQGHAEVCEYLISAGADVHAARMRCLTPLHMAVKGLNEERALEVTKLLTAHGASSSFAAISHKKWYLTPFQEAVQTGSASVVAHLINECGEHPDQLTANGRKMLEIARKDEVKQLLGMLLTEQAVTSALTDAEPLSDTAGRARANLYSI